jgi:mono/diheme cytochrome c family protein
VSAKNVDNRSTDELLETISSLEGKLQEEVSSVRNFSVIGIGVFAAGLIGIIAFDASSIPLKHKMRPALNLATAAQGKYDIELIKAERNMHKTLVAATQGLLDSGRSILAESNFGGVLAAGKAAKVGGVKEGSPAKELGLAANATINSINGRAIKNARDYRNALMELVNMQPVAVAWDGGKEKTVAFKTSLAFADFKHEVQHFAHAAEGVYSKYWAEQKQIISDYQVARLKLEDSFHRNATSGGSKDSEKADEQALKDFDEAHKKKLDNRAKGLESTVKTAASHLSHLIENEAALKAIVLDGKESFLGKLSSALSGYWSYKVGEAVRIEYGRKYGFKSEQKFADEAYKVYRGYMEPKLIEFFGGPKTPDIKGFNKLEEDADPEELPYKLNNNALLKRGQSFYFRHCQHCHGVSGYGDGPTAPFLNPLPRNYTRGIFKLKSNTSTKPSIKDLERTIKYGMPGSMMPPFELYRASDIKAVSHYVRYLAFRGEVEYIAYSQLIAGKEIQGIIEDPEAEEDPIALIEEKFVEAYDLVKEGWQTVGSKLIPMDGEPVALAPGLPRVPDAAMLGSTHGDLQAKVGGLSGNKSWQELQSQKGKVENLLAEVKAANEKALAPLKQALAAAEALVKSESAAKAGPQKAGKVAEAKGKVVTAKGAFKVRADELKLLEINLDSWARHSAWASSIKQGEELFGVNCARCHGFGGRGGGAEGEDFDSWGGKIKPRNLTRGIYRGGGRPVDIYWRFMGGIGGTPMPSFPNLKPEERWAIVNYVKHLATNDGRK